LKYKLKYSPDARDKLRCIKAQITLAHGKTVAVHIVSKMMGEIKGLKDNPQKGPSVEALLGIPTQYRFLHVSQNYVFYRIEDDTIFVTDIYNEREDFLRRIFGVNLRTSESIDYWGQ